MIEIRKAKPQDARDIKKVHISAYHKSYRGFLPDEFLDGLKLEEEVVLKTAERIKTHDYFIAVDDNKIVAFAVLIYPDAKTIEIEAIYAAPEYHGKGIGSKLVDYICGLSNKTVVAWTLKNGPSIGFYIKNGFKQVAGVEKFWKFNLPIIKFEKTIDKE
ncbi:MAG: GNAT family N-acetyltransferase [Alphaproteobacteria bacterium]